MNTHQFVRSETVRGPDADLQDFFENGAVALHLVGPNGTILRANRAELELLGYSAEEYIGRNIVDFHADQKVIDDILTRLRRGERLDRHPAMLLAKDGSIRHVEITSSVQFIEGKFVNTRCFTVDVSELRHAQQLVKEKEKHLEEVLNALPAAVYTTDVAGKITYFNDAAVTLAGRVPTVGHDEWCVTWRLRSQDGTPLPHEECPMAIAIKEKRPVRGMQAFAERPDGSIVPFAPYPTPLFDAQGELSGAVNMLVDLTEQKEREDHIEFVMRELSHRSKNLLAVVQAMASRSIRTSSSFPEFERKFMGRIQAMSRTHDILVANDWSGADIRQIIESEISTFLVDEGPQRAILTGESIILSPTIAQNVSLAVHELATNAVKYGALAEQDGRIEIDWRPHNGTAVNFRWREFKAGKPRRSARRGFGTQMLTSFFDEALFDFTPTGLQFSGRLSYARQ